MTGSRQSAAGPDFGRVALASGLVMFAILQLVAAARAGWVFEYPLDDTYIHLAMAAQIAHGGYGVNAGEYASAASSALYPLLLAPFADTAFQRYLPLIWNIVGLSLTMWLWGRALVWAGYRGWQGWVLALTVPLLSGALTAAYTGMEHSLHAAATVAIMFGLMRFLVEEKLTPMLFIGIFFSPLFRFEGLALVTMAIFTLAAYGQWRAALFAAVIGYLPILVFMGFLVSIGLGPLPNSVQAKLVSAEDVNMGLIERAYWTVLINISKYGGRAIVGLIFGAILLRVIAPALKQRRWTFLLLAMMAAGFGHLALAQTGWMERYEHYLVVSFTLAIAVMAGFSGERRRLASVIAVLALFASGYYYAKMLVVHYTYGSRAINAQQAQMARFAQDYLHRNVAVNDLGRVAWHNPSYVLDLYGLANDEARYIRLHDPEPGWAGPLAAEHDVSVIMVYDSWLGEAVDPAWVPLGKLVFQHPRGFLGDIEVSFYARNPQEAAYAQAALREWKKTLVRDTCFIPMEATACPG